MAKFDLKFIDIEFDDSYVKTYCIGDKITVVGRDKNGVTEIWLDKSTAIKFAKTLRTEINKIIESEVDNG
jgi:hypothetical protein